MKFPTLKIFIKYKDTKNCSPKGLKYERTELGTAEQNVSNSGSEGAAEAASPNICV